MAAVTKVGSPSYSQHLSEDSKIVGLYVGEDIGAGDACVISSDGGIYLSDGSGTTRNFIHGFAAKAALVAQTDPLTLVAKSANWGYGSGLTPGIPVYLSGSVKGRLDTATSSNVTKPCGHVVDSQRVRLWPVI